MTVLESRPAVPQVLRPWLTFSKVDSSFLVTAKMEFPIPPDQKNNTAACQHLINSPQYLFHQQCSDGRQWSELPFPSLLWDLRKLLSLFWALTRPHNTSWDVSKWAHAQEALRAEGVEALSTGWHQGTLWSQASSSLEPGQCWDPTVCGCWGGRNISSISEYTYHVHLTGNKMKS